MERDTHVDNLPNYLERTLFNEQSVSSLTHLEVLKENCMRNEAWMGILLGSLFSSFSGNVTTGVPPTAGSSQSVATTLIWKVFSKIKCSKTAIICEMLKTAGVHACSARVCHWSFSALMT